MFTVNMHTERRDRGDSARLSCVSCGSGWSVPCVSIQLTLSQHELFTEHSCELHHGESE
jgi:hypothetical protein